MKIYLANDNASLRKIHRKAGLTLGTSKGSSHSGSYALDPANLYNSQSPALYLTAGLRKEMLSSDSNFKSKTIQ